MIHAVAKIKLGPRIVEAVLEDYGWTCEIPVVQQALNDLARPSLFGPSMGEPIMCAIAKVQDFGAEVEILAPVESEPGVIY